MLAQHLGDVRDADATDTLGDRSNTSVAGKAVERPKLGGLLELPAQRMFCAQRHTASISIAHGHVLMEQNQKHTQCAHLLPALPHTHTIYVGRKVLTATAGTEDKHLRTIRPRDGEQGGQ